MCISTNKVLRGEEKWVGEDEEEVGVDAGLEGAHSAICLPGRDQGGYMVEEHAGGSSHPPFRQMRQ